LHQVVAVVSIPLGIVLIALADTGEARLAAVVYSLGVTGLFATSAAFHRGDWSARAALWMKRADHAMIFVLIASSYTPLPVLLLEGGGRAAVLAAIWGGTALGVVASLSGLLERRGVPLTMYIGLSWILGLSVPSALSELSVVEVALMFAGGVLYTAGAVALALRWPDPAPETFGYHEIWHVLVVLAGACIGVVVWTVILTAG